MAAEYHIIIELPEHGFDRPNIYTATLDDLRAKGWKPSHGYQNMSDDTIVDEGGKTLSEAFESWDAKGNDAWVSEAAYSATKKFGPRK
jgi:hypothetical protein